VAKRGKALRSWNDNAQSQLTCNRSADTMTGTKDSESWGHPSSSTAAKKARTSPEPNTASPKTEEKAASKQLEAKKSPVSLQVGDHKEAPREKATEDLISSSSVKVPTTGKCSHSEKPQGKSNMPRLPPMLSPLSSVVELEIVKMTSAVRNNKSEVTKSTSSVNSPSALPSKPEHAAPGKAGKPSTVEKPAAATKQTKSAIVAKGPHAQKSVTSAPSQAINNADVRAAATPKATASGQASGSKLPSTPTPKTTPPDGHKKMRLRVALKIKKKANRKNLHTYLSLKPTPGRNSLFPNRPIGQSHPSLVSTANAKTGNNVRDTQKADKVEPKSNRSTGPKTGEKRGRTHLEDDEPGPSTKRKSTARIEQIQKPSTPKSVPTSSPAMSQLGSAQKPSASTPGAQASSTAMQRALSGQGTVHTPQQSVVAGTPTAPTTGQRRRSYTSPDKPKSADLRSEFKHYQQVARTLKHEADKYLKKQDMMTEKDREQGLVIGTESVLCFMLAFVLLDTGGHYSDRASWNSILPFLKNLQGAAGDFPSLKHLSGLLCQLEGVIRDQVAYADLQQLDKNPVKHENENPSAQYTQAHCLQKANEYHKSFQEYHSHVMKAQSAWRLGWFKLNVARLPSHYPETWAKRDEERFAYGKGRDAVMRNEYTRKYSLPMGNMTSGLEAVNFGMNFLAEWTKTKGVEWDSKLVL